MRVFDSLGTTLPDDAAARTHAQKVADDFARAFQRAIAVRVTNDLGEVVFRTPSQSFALACDSRPVARGIPRCVT